MSNTYFIEKSIIASELNSEMQTELNPNYFTDMFHRKLVNGINRLKQLKEYVDFEMLRFKFIEAKKWTMQEDNQLVDMMTNTIPFGSNSTFNSYYEMLKSQYKDNSDKRYSI